LEDDGYFYAQLELPGMKKEEVKISLNDNILTISGEKKKQDLYEKVEYRRVERSYGVFERGFRFPQEIQKDAILAEMDNGILKISIRKTEKVEPRQIAIN
jgi:HSP20 family protein